MSAKYPTEKDIILGRNIQKYRESMGMTRQAAAQLFGFTAPQLAKIEKGENRINASRLHDFSIITCIPMEKFFEETDEEEEVVNVDD